MNRDIHLDTRTRLLTRSETQSVLALEPLTSSLRRGLVASAADGWRRERIPFDVGEGSFHLVAGGIHTDHGPRFVTKVNGWFTAGVTGFTVLCDAENGSVLALMDSAVLTQMRTAALTAVACEVLSPPVVRCLGLLGAGRQATLQAPAVRLATGVDRVVVWDIDGAARRQLVGALREDGFLAAEATSAEDCAAQSEVIVSVVPSTQPILRENAVMPGTLVIALGADAPGKREHETGLLKRAKIVTDVTSLCAKYGELQHPIAEGALSTDDVQAELAEVLAGVRTGRDTVNDIVLFDSTGNAVQDAVAASFIEDRARRDQIGTMIDLRS